MNELKIEISQEPAVIRCNFEDVKAKLSEKMAEYQGAVFTEESKSVAKAELASLRKTREEVEKRRKEVKSQCLAPYNDFETKVKELLEIITWKQLGLYLNPIVILNVKNYFDPLLDMLRQAVDENFMRTQHGAIWHVAQTPQEAVELIYTTPLWDASIRKFAAI